MPRRPLAARAARRDALAAMSKAIRKIAINTGGGDAPGLNAVIRAATLAALERGMEVCGIRHGYHGLLDDEPGGLIRLDRDQVRGIMHVGRHDPRHRQPRQPLRLRRAQRRGRRPSPIDRIAELVRRFLEQGFDALIAIGGDGSLRIAQRLHRARASPW